MPSSGQNGFRRFVRRTSLPATVSVALSTSTGIWTRGLRGMGRCRQRFEFRRARAMADGALDGNIVQFEAGRDTAEHQAAAAHVAAPDEMDRECELTSEDGQQDVDV